MEYLVTGGAGFIGSHLCEKLVNAGHTVRALDNLSTGRLENVSSLEDNDNFELIVDSIMNEETVKDSVARADRIYHLAAAVGVKYIIDNPLESIEINVRGTENVLHAANRDKTPVFLASTSEIYGKNEKVPFSEEDNRVLGSTEISRWSYSCTKALDEFLAFAFWREKNLPVVIGRFFNTVGPRQTGRYGMVIPRFVKQAQLDRPITVYDDGQQTRAFIDVEDTTDVIIELLDRKDARGQVYNIGGTNRISIEELAQKIIKVTGSSSDIKYIPYEEAYESNFEDMRHRVPDVSKLKEELDFSPRYELEDILKRIIDYFHTNEEFK